MADDTIDGVLVHTEVLQDGAVYDVPVNLYVENADPHSKGPMTYRVEIECFSRMAHSDLHRLGNVVVGKRPPDTEGYWRIIVPAETREQREWLPSAVEFFASTVNRARHALG